MVTPAYHAAIVRDALRRERFYEEGPTMRALDALLAQAEAAEKRKADVRTAMGAAERFRAQGIKDAERAEAAEAERDAAVRAAKQAQEALRPIIREYNLWSEDANDGEFRQDCEHDYVFVYGFSSEDDFFRCDKCGQKSDDGVYPKVGNFHSHAAREEGADTR